MAESVIDHLTADAAAYAQHDPAASQSADRHPPDQRSRSRASSSAPSATSSGSFAEYNGPEGEQWGVGSAFDYVRPEEISDWIKCAICLGPFVEPLSASTCAHTFCAYCIRRHYDRCSSDDTFMNLGEGSSSSEFSRPCPSCRLLHPLSGFTPANLLIKGLVDALTVSCPLEPRGCLWIGERSLLGNHILKECEWAWVGEFDGTQLKALGPSDGPSSSTGGEMGLVRHRRRKAKCDCGKRVLRKDWDEHRTAGCAAKWTQCQWCHELIKDVSDDTGEQIHAASCESFPMECPRCRETISRSSMAAHLNGDCPEIPVACSMAAYGCPWRGPRSALVQPTGRNASTIPEPADATAAEQRHQCAFLPLRPYLEASDARLHALESENARIRTVMAESQRREEERFEDLYKLWNDLPESWRAMQDSLAHQVHEARREAASAKVEIGLLSEEVTNLRMAVYSMGRHLHTRGAPSSLRPGFGGGVEGQAQTRPGQAVASSSKEDPEEALPTDFHHGLSLGAGHFSPYGHGGGLPPPMGSYPPTHSSPLAPHQHHPHVHPHHYAYGGMPPMPGSGLRRFWSGFEQTKL